MSRASAPAAALARAAPVFAALGDETRLQIVSRLSAEGPLSATRLAEGAPVTRQAVVKHLRALSGAGLVRDRREGRERVFALEPRRLEEARLALARVSAAWDEAALRLRAFVEES